MNGFYWSTLMTFYHFVKYIKLEDLIQADCADSFNPELLKNNQNNLRTSHLLVSEYGSLVSYKKNSRL